MLHKLFTRSAKQSSDLDVVIHIGAPKTGSSAIQRFCINNRSLLLEYGFYYPKHSLDRNGISGGHQSVLAKFLIDKNQEEAKHRFCKLLRRAKRQNACLLLSAEGFYGQADMFAPLLDGLNIKVIGWFRSPIDSFISNYNQAVKRHFSKKRLADVCDGLFPLQAAPHFTGDYLIRWAEVVGAVNCNFMPYGHAFKQGHASIEKQWLSTLGLSSKAIKKFNISDARVNRSYTPEALELKRLLNQVLDESIAPICHRIDWALQHYSDQSEHPDTPIEQLLSEDNIIRLNEYFFTSDLELTTLFPVLKEVFQPVVCSDITKRDSVGIRDVSVPFNMISKEHPEDIELLQKRVLNLLEEAEPTFSTLRLAELFNIPFSEPVTGRDLMPASRLQTLLGSQCEKPDFLRELALIMELAGDLKSAKELIAKALELRPHGPGIIKIHDRLFQVENAV